MSAEQLDIFDGATALDQQPLSDRQRVALTEIGKADGGLASDEVGAVVHEAQGHHDRGVRCEWCRSSGLEVARALKRKGLVVLRRGGMWQSTRPLDSGPSLGRGPESSASASDTVDSARARSTDPATSQQAAASVRDLTGKQQAVLDCFRRCGPMTDEQLCAAYPSTSAPVQTESGLRTRRHELVDAGALRDSGRKGETRAGRASIVWELADGIPF